MAGAVEKKIERVIDSNSLQVALLKKTNEVVELNEKIKSQALEIQSLKSELDIINKKADKRIEAVERTARLYKINDEVIKTILRLKARNMSIMKIENWCNDNGISITTQDVEHIIKNINMLSPTLEAYYNEECKAFNENLQINPSSLKQTIIDTTASSMAILEELIHLEKSKRDESGEPNYDIGIIVKLLNELNGHSKTYNSLIGNIVEEGRDAPQINLEIQNLQNELRDRSDKIIKFGLGNVKVI
jgi:hypothetical protein